MKKKISQTTIFVQDCGPWRQEFFVAINATRTQVLGWAKKNKIAPDIIEELEDKKNEHWNDLSLGSVRTLAQFCWDDTTHIGILYMRDYQDVWEYWETLIHELHHVVSRIMKNKGTHDDLEPGAYLQEWLFRQIRHKLQGVEKIS